MVEIGSQSENFRLVRSTVGMVRHYIKRSRPRKPEGKSLRFISNALGRLRLLGLSCHPICAIICTVLQFSYASLTRLLYWKPSMSQHENSIQIHIVLMNDG
jgi:hypothetical protein